MERPQVHEKVRVHLYSRKATEKTHKIRIQKQWYLKTLFKTGEVNAGTNKNSQG